MDMSTSPFPMPDTSADIPGPISLRTLVRLRWLAVFGQSLAVLIVHFLLEFPLPLGSCLAVIALSAWINIFLSLKWRGSVRLSPLQAGSMMGYDILQLAALLYLTGGLENPFSFLFLVPVTVSATTLPLRWTLLLSAVAFICATILALYHLPLPWSRNAPLALPSIYIGGLWVAILCGVVFSAIYARRIAEEARQMSAAYTAAELVLAREQRLSALDGMAAAAAHELGTPLATIALVAKELKRELPKKGPHTEDIDLLISQTARCREILSRLANRERQADTIYDQVKLSVMLEDLIAPLRGPDISIDVTLDGQGPAEPVFRRNPAITYGLANLLENAVDFAEEKVLITGSWTVQKIMVEITDDGPGFDPGVFERLGDPFVTTRPGYGADEAQDARSHEGMGLGFFIAKTLLERSGAQVFLSNRGAPGHGAAIRIAWPRVLVDVGDTIPIPTQSLTPVS
jgi:two-component system, sensor histidine kinase RegB